MQQTIAIFFSVILGVGLSACCGLRVFVPLLVAGVAQRMGYIHLHPQFEWMGANTALIIFATASLLEIIAYKIPFIDHALDTITTPSSIIAGTVLSAAHMADVDPAAKWVLALIVGGGSAGMVQLGTTLLRGVSTTTTAGVANPIFAAVETLTAVVASLISIAMPVLMCIVVAIVVVPAAWYWWRHRQRTNTKR